MSKALYFSPQPTRSARARWAFIEVGASFEAHAVDVFKGEHKAESYLALNPLGYVPTATFDGEVVLESAALAYIAAAEHPDAGLVPKVGSAAWRKAMQWVVFAPAELDPLMVTLNTHRLFRPPPQRNKELVEQATDLFSQRAKYVTSALGSGPHLLGDAFSVADICVGHSIAWAKMHDLLRGFPALQAYLDRLQKRPAFQEVYGPKVDVYPDPHAK